VRQKQLPSANFILSELEDAKTFNPDVHIPELFDMAKDGLTESQILASWKITEHTWSEWLNDHKSLRDAWNIAKRHITNWWIEYGKGNIENRNFNKNLWESIATSAGVQTKERLIKIMDCDESLSLVGLSKKILTACLCGEISHEETKSLIAILSGIAKVEEVVDLRRQIEDMEHILHAQKDVK
jgi:hypothetical protein